MAVVIQVSTATPILLLVVIAAVVLLPNVACDEVKLVLGTAVTGSTKLMLTSVEAVPGKAAVKLKPDFALCTIFVDVSGFSLVKLSPLNENMTLFVTWPSPSDFSSICFVWVEVTGSLFKPVVACPSPLKSAVTSFVSEDRRFFDTPPDGFWSSLDAGGWNCESCGTPKQNSVCENKLVSVGFTIVSDADGEVAFPKLQPVETAVDVHVSAVLGILSDVTLGTPNMKPCKFDEEALSDSFTALSIPKLNFMAECDSEPGLAPSHATHFNESLLFCTIQVEQFHIPDDFFNLSPNEISTVDFVDDVSVGLVAKAGPFVS